ncbi:MAG TPA: VWA domain-containing protein [Steroidobacteraceae bacterium]|nr:VWA domain-containing protein [Steroidobacteraceae bacterium]
MRSFVALLLAFASGAVFAAPSIDAPATALAGAKITIKATGTGNPREFVSVVLKGTPVGKYNNYQYLNGPGPYELETPPEPGDYEVRIYGADSPYATLLAKPIRLGTPTATIKAPAQVDAGQEIEISWTGPNNERDYIGIGETTPNGQKYLAYFYVRFGSPQKLLAPERTGKYEIRYFLGSGDKIILAVPLQVGGVTASVSGPAQVGAGGKLKVSWTGPANPRDFVTIVKEGTPEKTFDRYQYVTVGNPLDFIAPDSPGNYEIRYLTGGQYLTLAHAKLVVTPTSGALTGPATVVAGEAFKVGWKGPDNPRNYVTIVAKGAREGDFSASYAYTDARNPVTLLAPLVAGDYELRYLTAQENLTLARAAIKVTPAKSEPGKVAVTLAAGTKAGGAVEIILDASGSMLQKLGAQRRIDIAKATLTKLTTTTIPAGTPFALRVFGREVDSCQTDLDVAIGPLNAAAVKARIAALNAKNGAKTPIGESLVKAADDLKSVGGEKLIVLITDGEETCGGDPAAAIAALRKAGVSTRVSIVGFALEDQQLAATFRRWADAGGGAFFAANDAAGLDKSLTEALRPGFEVVNAAGQVLASGIVGGEPVTVPAGNHNVRLKGRAGAPKPVVVKPKETATVPF